MIEWLISQNTLLSENLWSGVSVELYSRYLLDFSIKFNHVITLTNEPTGMQPHAFFVFR